jgi:alkylhydroperoxidase family enzyme
MFGDQTLVEVLKLASEPIRRGRLYVMQAVTLSQTPEQAGTIDVSTLEPRLRELIRVRSAGLNGCRLCQVNGPAYMQNTDLPRVGDPEKSADITDRERLALVYLDRFSFEPQSIDGQLFERLKTCFSAQEIIDLTHTIAFLVALHKINMVLDLDPESGAEGIEEFMDEFFQGEGTGIRAGRISKRVPVSR